MGIYNDSIISNPDCPKSEQKYDHYFLKNLLISVSFKLKSLLKSLLNYTNFILTSLSPKILSKNSVRLSEFSDKNWIAQKSFTDDL